MPMQYVQQAQYNADNDVAIIRKATKGFGTDERALISVLANKTPSQTIQLSLRFEQLVGKPLVQVIQKETSGCFRSGLVGCAMGPLSYEVHLLHSAMKGAGTDEVLLTEILMGRLNSEIQGLKNAYRQEYGVDLASAVRGELSMKTERMFNMVLTGARDDNGAPVNPGLVQQDVAALYDASARRIGTDEITVCGILLSRSDPHLKAVAQHYAALYRTPLTHMIRSEFSGHMKAALIHAVEGGLDAACRDAGLYEEAMAGMGTREERLMQRVVRNHWDWGHARRVRDAYARIYGKDLVARVQGETSGDLGRLLVALIVV